MRDQRVMVAGGAGFVGSQLVRELLAQGARVMVFDNYQTGTHENLADVRGQIDVVIGDLLDEFSLLEAFRRYRPTTVFNLAAETFVPTAFEVPKRFLAINLEGHLNLLMACRHFEVERVVYASTAEVYGQPGPGPISESHPLGAANTYAVSKLAADQLSLSFHREHNIPVVVARLFNTYGPRESEPYVIPEIIAQLDAGGPVRLGNLAARRDFTYVADTARALVALQRPEVSVGQALNVGSGHTHTVEEIARTIADIMGRPLELARDDRRLRPHDIEHLQADSQRISECTGWAPTLDIRRGLEETVSWFIENGRRWPWQDRVVPPSST